MGLFLVAFFILLLFTLVLKKSLLLSSAVSLFIVIVLGAFFQILDLVVVVQAGIHGTIVASEISLLVLGALAFFNYLKSGGFIQKLESALKSFSTNKLVIIILVAFYFGSFIEGVSGFGTPAMIVAPILLGLRFPPYLAASLSLLANTIPVVFGAVGTPVTIGFAELHVTDVAVYTTLLMVLPTILMPFAFMRLIENEVLSTKSTGTGKLYFISLMAGIAFVIPFIAISLFSTELPSIIASIIGLLIWFIIVKYFGGSIASINSNLMKQLLKTFWPYLFITFLLIAGKLLLGKTQFTLHWPEIGLKKNINFFQPGLIFIIGLLLFALISGKKVDSIKPSFKESFRRIPTTFSCIACLSIMARLLSSNLHVQELFDAGYIPDTLAPTFAVATGCLGSFIAGSATMSNLMFGSEWYTLGMHSGLNTSVLLAGQLTGAALGNALSIQNIAMVQAVLNETGLERKIFKSIWKSVLFFFLLISIAAILGGLFVKKYRPDTYASYSTHFAI
jgi:lactate permease